MTSRLALLFLLTGCASSPTGPGDARQAELDAARARWEAAGLVNYDYHYRFVCGVCLPAMGHERLVQVRNGVVTVVRDLVADTLVTFDLPGYAIPRQFDRIQGYIDARAAMLEVEYHAVLGSPVSVAVDPIDGALDDEHGFHIRDLEPSP